MAQREVLQFCLNNIANLLSTFFSLCQLSLTGQRERKLIGSSRAEGESLQVYLSVDVTFIYQNRKLRSEMDQVCRNGRIPYKAGC